MKAALAASAVPRGLGSSRRAPARPTTGSGRVNLWLRCRGSPGRGVDLAHFAGGLDGDDESLLGASQPDVLEVLHRHASRWSWLASFPGIGHSCQYSFDRTATLQS